VYQDSLRRAGHGRSNDPRRRDDGASRSRGAAQPQGILGADRDAVPGSIQRQRSAQPAALDGRRHGDRPQRAGDICIRGYVHLLSAVSVVEHARWLAGRSLQQARCDHLDQGHGIRLNACGHGGPGHAFIASVPWGAGAGGEPGSTIRANEVWPAAGAAAGEEPFLGEWRHRTRHVSRHHCRHGGRRGHGRGLSRPRSLCRLCAAWTGRRRVSLQSGDRQDSRRRAAEAVPR
jgi:hypothetical protein